MISKPHSIGYCIAKQAYDRFVSLSPTSLVNASTIFNHSQCLRECEWWLIKLRKTQRGLTSNQLAVLAIVRLADADIFVKTYECELSAEEWWDKVNYWQQRLKEYRIRD